MGYTPPFLYVTKVGTFSTIYGLSNTTGDSLDIIPNLADPYARIRLIGNGDLNLYCKNAGATHFFDTATEVLRVQNTGGDCALTSIVNGNNLLLATTGAGVVKFGTYSAGAATDSTGYITIKDSGGTSRKLMVQA